MNLKRHHVLYGLLAVSLIISLLLLLHPGRGNMSYIATSTPVEVSGVQSTTTSQMQIEVVTTSKEQALGLGGREDIPSNYGMLFVFSEKERVGFWMKGMLTSIDIIWLSDNGTIVGIEKNVSPSTYPESFFPPEPVRFVLETRAGETERKGWSVGTQISLPLPSAN
jgi:uncharacterized membrane protein (UPF0127 family)